MPTVSSVVNQASMIASLSPKFFGSNRAAANQSIIVGGGYNGFFNFLTSEFGGQPAITNLVENYQNNKETFDETFQENLDNLKESSEKVKETADTEEVVDVDNDQNTGSTLSTLGEFAAGNIPPELRNLANIPLQPQNNSRPQPPPPPQNALQNFAENYLTAENANNTAQTSNENSRLNDVRNLVRDFNATKSYLDENRGVSNRMAALADNFNNNNLNNSLNQIGISVNSQGFLSLNESTFSNALNNNSEVVNSTLGSGGLAGQLDRNIGLANFQRDRLFTSILSYANSPQNESESLYSNRANYATENTPRLFAMLT